MTGERRTGLESEVQRTQLKPVAGIWVCPNCGRRIQLITDSEVAKVKPFTCVCGAEMEPGDEHSEVGHDDATEAAPTVRVEESRTIRSRES
jgi:hypothetical protein